MRTQQGLQTPDQTSNSTISGDLSARKDSEYSQREKFNRTQKWASSLHELEIMGSSDSQEAHFPTPPASAPEADTAEESNESIKDEPVNGEPKLNYEKYRAPVTEALAAGVTEAFRLGREQGPWADEKTRQAVAAALDAGGIENPKALAVLKDVVTGVTRLFQSPDVGDDHSSVGPKSGRTTRSESTYSKRRSNGRAYDERGHPISPRRYISSEGSESSYSSSVAGRIKRKEATRGMVDAGFAIVSTLNAARNIYDAFEKREARHKAMIGGEITPEEVRKFKMKATLQDTASVGVAALGIKEAISRWKGLQDDD
jgi:hypothetical protein